MDTHVVGDKVKQVFEQSKSKEKRAEWLAQAQEKYGQATGKAQETIATLSDKQQEARQNIDHRLDEYNTKMETLADRLPGDLNQTITRYPWMTLLAALSVGLLIGLWLKPCFKKYEYKYKYYQGRAGEED